MITFLGGKLKAGNVSSSLMSCHQLYLEITAEVGNCGYFTFSYHEKCFFFACSLTGGIGCFNKGLAQLAPHWLGSNFLNYTTEMQTPNAQLWRLFWDRDVTCQERRHLPVGRTEQQHITERGREGRGKYMVGNSCALAKS